MAQVNIEEFNEFVSELSKVVQYLRTVDDDTPNQEIAENLGLNLDEFSFDELIAIGEIDRAKRLFPDKQIPLM